jgi:hypothetical protein
VTERRPRWQRTLLNVSAFLCAWGGAAVIALWGLVAWEAAGGVALLLLAGWLMEHLE